MDAVIGLFEFPNLRLVLDTKVIIVSASFQRLEFAHFYKGNVIFRPRPAANFYV